MTHPEPFTAYDLEPYQAQTQHSCHQGQ